MIGLVFIPLISFNFHVCLFSLFYLIDAEFSKLTDAIKNGNLQEAQRQVEILTKAQLKLAILNSGDIESVDPTNQENYDTDKRKTTLNITVIDQQQIEDTVAVQIKVADLKKTTIGQLKAKVGFLQYNTLDFQRFLGEYFLLHNNWKNMKMANLLKKNKFLKI